MFTFGEVSMTSVNNMVNNVLAAAQWQKIEMLRIVDHGSVEQVDDKKGGKGKKGDHHKKMRCNLQFGDDKVNVGNFKTYAAQFERLVEKFASDGYVHLAHCWAAKDHELLRLFAGLFGVPVYAGTGKRAQWTRTQFGELVVCYPNGKIHIDVELPD
jgi:hypothetical protein